MYARSSSLGVFFIVGHVVERVYQPANTNDRFIHSYDVDNVQSSLNMIISLKISDNLLLLSFLDELSLIF